MFDTPRNKVLCHGFLLILILLFSACSGPEKAIPETKVIPSPLSPAEAPVPSTTNQADVRGTIPLDISRIAPAPPGFASAEELRHAWDIGQLRLVNAQPERPADVVEYSAMEYAQSNGQSLTMDLAISRSAVSRSTPQGTPILIFVHGEAWSGSGSRTDLRSWIYRYAKKGHLAVAVDYGMEVGCGYPKAIDNLCNAVTWLRTNAARYNADPHRVILIGVSDGGYAALMAAMDPARKTEILAVAAFGAPTNLETLPTGALASTRDRFFGTDLSSPDLLRQASPIALAGKQKCPVLILHGSLDDSSPVSQSDMFADKLQSLNAPFFYERLKGWGNTITLQRELTDHVEQILDLFLASQITNTAP